MNRLRLLLEESEEHPTPDEYFVLYGTAGTWYVSRQTACLIEQAL
jgi:hypothetical protein